jgi:ketosteroid isomerase-like protein
MNKIKAIVLIPLFFVAFHSQCQTYVGPQKDIEDILKVSAAFSQSYMDGDFEAIANAYTENGLLLPPGSDIIQGREKIKSRWTLPQGVQVILHKAIPEKIEVIGSTAYDVGYYHGKTLRKDGSEASWKGKYVIIWKKEANEWKIDSDIWNNRN